MTTMQIARIYMAESDAKLETIMDYLHDTAKIQGVTVFKAIKGYGSSGTLHSSKLLYLSMDLPIVLEFYDTKEKISASLEYFSSLLGPGHILTWEVNVI
jgi:PII-like signaling protein